MAGTLISYRAGDSPGHAGRLFDRLRARLPKHPVRKDVSQVAPGEDFVQAIENAVALSDTVLVVIGRDWLSSTSAGGRRLDDPNDPVRLEIAAALLRKLRVIPVLVEGASMPPEPALPTEIRGLARRQAVELRDASWDLDVENLIAAMAGRKPAAGRDPNRSRRFRRIAVAGGILCIGMLVLLSFVFMASGPSHTGRTIIGTPVVRIHPELTLVAHGDIGSITALQGQRIASLKSGEVTIWNLASGESQALYKEYGLASIAGLPDGRLALGFWGEIKLMNTDTGKVEANIDLHDPYGDKTDTSIDELTLLPDGTLVSFSGVSIGFCDWKAHAGHVIPMNVSSHFVLLSGSRLVLLPGRGGIGVWNLRDQKPETLLPGDPDAGPENDLALLPDGQIATTSQQGVLALWNLETGKKKILRTADHMWDRYSNLFPLPDGRLVALGGESIEVWSVSRDRPDVVQTVARRKEMADPLLLADGRLLVATDDSGILLWNPQTKRPEAILEGHTKSPRHFVLLGDNRLASAGEDRTIRIWKIPANGGR